MLKAYLAMHSLIFLLVEMIIYASWSLVKVQPLENKAWNVFGINHGAALLSFLIRFFCTLLERLHSCLMLLRVFEHHVVHLSPFLVPLCLLVSSHVL